MKKTQFRSFKQVSAKKARHKARREHNLALYRQDLTGLYQGDNKLSHRSASAA